MDIDHADESARPAAPLGSPAAAGLGALSEELASARDPGTAAGSGATGAGPAAAKTSPAPAGPVALGSAPHRSSWPARLRDLADAVGQWLARPPVRLALMGVLLLAIAGLFVANSFWTLPLVIVGVLMVLIAWVGSRLHGHFVVEWGESGTQVQFRAQITPARHQHKRVIAVPAFTRPPGLPDREPIEGEAHTVEIDIGELKALIAAAEADDAGPSPAPVRNGSSATTGAGDPPA